MFEHIKFPFFGLKKKPFSVEFTLDKIFVVRTGGSHKETVDDKSLQGDYFARLAQMDVRLDFDCTCKDHKKGQRNQLWWNPPVEGQIQNLWYQLVSHLVPDYLEYVP